MVTRKAFHNAQHVKSCYHVTIRGTEIEVIEDYRYKVHIDSKSDWTRNSDLLF